MQVIFLLPLTKATYTLVLGSFGGWARRSTLNSKTRIGPNSELSSSAPLPHFSPENDQPPAAQPSRSEPHVRLTSDHARRKFGRKIQALRQQAGLTLEDLSKQCGITTTRLKMIEAGQEEPRLFTIISLAEKLRTTADDLLKEIE